jgi:hypothetical protein
MPSVQALVEAVDSVDSVDSVDTIDRPARRSAFSVRAFRSSVIAAVTRLKVGRPARVGPPPGSLTVNVGPKAADRERCEAVAKGEHPLAGVENVTVVEVPAGKAAEMFEMAEVLGAGGR